MRNAISVLPIFSLIILINACSPSIKNVPGVSLELAEYRKGVISEVKYDLELSIPDDQIDPISGRITIQFELSENNIDLPLDFRETADKLHSLKVNDVEAQITFENEHILLPQNLLIEGSNTATIDFTAGETSLNRNPEFLYTLFVPDRARTCFPLFDQPNLKATYDVTLHIPTTWAALSNGPLLSKTEQDSTTTWEFGTSDLMSSYLFSFVAGEFEMVTRNMDGVEMSMIHRETDEEKVDRNLDDIFELHKASLDWLEEYTDIDYPFQKFDFALIPSFQYGGMEHTGAIQYRASSLFLDESPSQSQLLSRASLIAHETAHMWFGNLVTMDWFNDVWTKEVYANFMAAKIMNPNFPEINHDLNFMVRHYPSSYSVDRTEGANPIRQNLPNLNEAGTMYGAIIYNKAPIMMRQLELLVGEAEFQEGIQEYLKTFADDNATWPELIDILDQKSDSDLKTWSEVWVNTPGRPHFDFLYGEYLSYTIVQNDEMEQNRIWPQSFEIQHRNESTFSNYSINSIQYETPNGESNPFQYIIPNSNGYGYGLFPQDLNTLEHYSELNDVARGSSLINIYENLLEGNVEPEAYFEKLKEIIQTEENQLLLNLALGHIGTIYWDVFLPEERETHSEEMEILAWDLMMKQTEPSRKRIFFNTWQSVVLSEEGLDRLHSIWKKTTTIAGLPLSENDYIGMAAALSIKSPERFEEVTSGQLTDIENPDRKRRFEFLIPALSNDQATRDEFFESLKNEENRQIESWVLSGLNYLHHPLRVNESEKYIQPSLELLEEIQQTGDIFFPGRWMGATLGNYSSDYAVESVRNFLVERPDYNYQLSLKILQSADMLFRMNEIQSTN